MTYTDTVTDEVLKNSHFLHRSTDAYFSKHSLLIKFQILVRTQDVKPFLNACNGDNNLWLLLDDRHSHQIFLFSWNLCHPFYAFGLRCDFFTFTLTIVIFAGCSNSYLEIIMILMKSGVVYDPSMLTSFLKGEMSYTRTCDIYNGSVNSIIYTLQHIQIS